MEVRISVSKKGCGKGKAFRDSENRRRDLFGGGEVSCSTEFTSGSAFFGHSCIAQETICSA